MSATLRVPSLRRSLRRRLAFAAVLLLVLWLLVECAAFAGYWLLRGERFSFTHVHALQDARARVAADAPAKVPASAFQDSGGDTCIHPYLGFVANRDTDDQMLLPARGFGVTPYGFVDDEGPVRKRGEHKLLVGIFGGSVAQFFGEAGADELAVRLRAHRAFADKRVEFVRLGLGGFKQPQQLFALTYLLALGGELDVAINLDGFNEATLGPLENAPRGIAADFPRNWALLAEHAPDPVQRRLMGTVTVLQQAQRSLAQFGSRAPWRWSVAASFLWESVDRWLDRAAAARLLDLQQARRDDLPFHLTGPGADAGAGEDVRAGDSVATWVRCSRAMQRICAAHGIRYFHFLQPNQYYGGSKPLTAEEARVAFDAQSPYRPWIERTYPRMRAASADLVANGVRFDDLTQLFAGVAESVYIDNCCHFNEAGNRRIAQAIAAAIVRDLGEGSGQPRAPLTAMTVDPPAPRLEAPFARLDLRVLGRRDRNVDEDVTYAGTVYASSDPAVVAVDRYGTLTALGDGDAQVLITCEGQRATVPVAVRFAPVVDLGGAFAPRPLQKPILQAIAQSDKLRLRVTPPGAHLAGAVSFATVPARRALCGGIVFVPAQSPLVQTLGASGGELTVDLVAPDARRRTIYVQAVYRAGDGTCGFAVSNALAITR